ncbi:MAG: hypothetical protein R3Y29_07170 [bacterium]
MFCWIGLGDLISVTNHRGEQVTRAKYALHLQSNFRIYQPTNLDLRIGYGDVFNPYGGVERPENFDFDVQGENFYDEKVAILQQNTVLMNSMIVKTVEISELFDLKIVFDNGVILETFSDCFCESVELWRLFTFGEDSQYIIACGTGIEYSFK